MPLSFTQMEDNLGSKKAYNQAVFEMSLSDSIMKENQIKKGQHLSHETEFKKGLIPWNKGRSWSEETKIKMRLARIGRFGNENHPAWKGNSVGYTALHDWIRRNKQKPESCEKCGLSRVLELANMSHEYKRDINDFKWFCKSCHYKYDGHGKILLESRKNNPVYLKRISEALKKAWIKRKYEKIQRSHI